MTDREPPSTSEPDGTAVRVALGRAAHLVVDEPPHVLDDDVGRQLVAPADGWLDLPEMSERFSRRWRASVVARARFVEDLVLDRLDRGVEQYVLLGAGCDSFAVRRVERSSRLRVFELDEPGTQAWKRRRLDELRLTIPPSLRFVAFDFESGRSWVEALTDAGFDPLRPAVVASLGVAQYLTDDALQSTMRDVAGMAAGTVFVCTFIVRADLIEPAEQAARRTTESGASASGHPWVSAYSPTELAALAAAAGFDDVRHVPSAELSERYFSARTDDLRPLSSEDLLVASVHR